MDRPPFNFAQVNTLPDTLAKDTLYLVSQTGSTKVKVYVTGNDRVAREVQIELSDILVEGFTEGNYLRIGANGLEELTPDQVKADIGATGEANVNADWNATSGDAEILNKPTIPSQMTDLDTEVTGSQLDTIKIKVDGIESGATADQTNEEIETAYNARVTQVSAGEIAAGTETETRRFSPADAASMADARISNYLTPQTLTDGATVTYDVSAGVKAYLTIAGDRVLAFSNLSNGDSGSLLITQDGTGSRAISSITGAGTPVHRAGELSAISSRGAGETTSFAWEYMGGNLYTWITPTS